MIHIRETGKGPAVLLLHGCPATTRGFAPIAERLSRSKRVVVPELPGYGASPPLDGLYSLARVEERLEAELLARGIREVEVVGHSAGAYRAFALALSGRVRVHRIVSLSGIAGYGDDVRAAFRHFATMVRDGVDLRPGWRARMTGPRFDEADPSDVADVMAWTTAAPTAVLAAELDAFAEAPDLRPRLRDLAIPILARVGDADQAAPVPFSREIVDHAANATLQIVQGCGHAIFYEDREGTREAVASFLSA
jgi:3-oxoadipate enol-lactonase